MKELDDMAKDTSSGMHATPLDPGNMMHLQGRFKGPPGTPYEGGEFVIDIRLPDNYPFMPPKMKFETKVWHPNVSSQTVSVFPSSLVHFIFLHPRLPPGGIGVSVYSCCPGKGCIAGRCLQTNIPCRVPFASTLFPQSGPPS